MVEDKLSFLSQFFFPFSFPSLLVLYRKHILKTGNHIILPLFLLVEGFFIFNLSIILEIPSQWPFLS